MKQIKVLIGITTLCITAALMSCSNDGDDNYSNSDIEGISIVKMGAPVINSGSSDSKTRVAFNNEDTEGLNITWKTGDVVKITPYQKGSSGWNAGTTITYTATADGETVDFSGAQDTQNRLAYWITINGGSTDNARADEWSALTCSMEQTQNGNDNKDHLKDNYRAVLKNITLTRKSGGFNETITFSQDFATAQKFDPTTTDAAGKPAESECGQFVQSSCVKFDFTLPTYASLTQISKVVVTANQVKDETSTAYSAFYKNNSGGSAQNTITLNVDNVTGISGNYNFIGYFMLTPNGLRTEKSSKGTCVYKIAVYYGAEDSDYIYRELVFSDAAKQFSDKGGNGGKLYVFKLKNTGWKTSAGVDI